MTVAEQIKIMESQSGLDLSVADVKGERIKAIATIVLTAGFNIANLFGYAYDAEPVINGVLTIISFILIIYSWWKNQNVTEEAATAQVLLRFLKGISKASDKKEKASEEPVKEAENAEEGE